MNPLLSSVDYVTQVWGQSIWRASWQGAIVLAVAWAIARWCTFLSPRVVCWVWRLACLKLLLGLVSIQPVELAWLPVKEINPTSPPVVALISDDGQNWTESRINPDALPAPAEAAASWRVSTMVAGLLLALWLIGVCWCLVRTGRQWKLAYRLRGESRTTDSDRLTQILSEEAKRLGIARLPRLALASQVESPLLVGIWRPTILLPEGAEQKFDEGELRLMIAHELAHQKRYDLLWNWLPTVAGWLFFFHPFVWLMRRSWSEAQEAACDEMLIQRQVAEPVGYGRLLVKLSACGALESATNLASAGVLGAYQNLQRRILAMARVRPFSARRLAIAAATLSIVGLLTIVPWRLVAEEPKADEQQPVYTVPFQTYTYQSQRPREAKPRDPAAQRALDRLRELGAAAAMEEGGLMVNIQDGWKGTGADLKLLAELADINQLVLDLDFVAPEAVGSLELKQPSKRLALDNLSDGRAEALTRLPKCRELLLLEQTLSAKGFGRLAEIADGIESLVTMSGDIDDAKLTEIAKIGSLKKLGLEEAEITDAGLRLLVALDNLEQLSLMGCASVGGPGYANLAGCKSLRKLGMSNMPIDASALRGLAKLTELRELHIWTEVFAARGLNPPDFDPLKDLMKLEELQIDVNPSKSSNLVWGDAILVVAAQMPALRSLRLTNLDVDAGGLAALAGTSHIEELSLGPIKLTDAALTALADLQALKQLRLVGEGPVSPSAWTKIGALKPLVDLWINDSGVDDEGLEELGRLDQMKNLNLTGSKITGLGLNGLPGLSRLKSLNLSSSPLDDDGAHWLRHFPAIETLDLSKTRITDRGLDAIATLANLRSLTLNDTQVTADGLLKLKDLKVLSMVAVSGTKYSAEDMKRLNEAMPEVRVFSSAGGPNSLRTQNPLTAAINLANQGKLDEAFASLEKAREQQPTELVVQWAVNLLKEHRHKATGPQLQLTLKWLHEALAADPEALPIQEALADLLELKGETNASIEVYRKLLNRTDLPPTERAIIENNLAYGLVERAGKGDVAEARALIDKSMQALEGYGAAFDTRGLVEMAEGDIPAAVTDFKRATREWNDVVSFFHLALAQQKAGNTDAAAAALRMAEERQFNPKMLSPAEQKDYERLKKQMAERAPR